MIMDATAPVDNPAGSPSEVPNDPGYVFPRRLLLLPCRDHHTSLKSALLPPSGNFILAVHTSEAIRGLGLTSPREARLLAAHFGADKAPPLIGHAITRQP